MAKGLSAAKAKKILQDGYIKGKRLTAKQREYFGAIASGATPLKAIDGDDVDKAQWGLIKWGKNLYDTARGIDKITDVAKVSKKFDSSIDWAKWNKSIPENKALMKEYNAIEKAAKADGTWMKNSDGSKFTGSPEQFVQQNSKSFKKAFPDGFTKGYRGAKHHIDDFVNRDRNDWATFLTDSKENAVTYAGSDGVPKTYFHPDVDKQLKIENGLYPPQVNGVYELGFPNNLPTVTGNANGKSWRLLDYDSTIEQGIKLDGRVGDHQQSLLNWTEEGFADDYGLQGFNPSARYLTTDNYASYVKNKANKEAVAKIKNVKDQMGYSDILANSVFAVDAERVPLKSLRHNDGMFDMTNSNIYKAIVPGAIGAGAASQMGPKQEDGQFKNGGWLDKFGMGGNLPGASGMMYSRNSGSSAMSPPNLTKAQDGDKVMYGTPEYEAAYEEGRFADVPNPLDEVVIDSGVDYEKYPLYDDLSEQDRQYFKDDGPIGRGVRRRAQTKRGLAEDTYDVVNPLMYGAVGLAGAMAVAPMMGGLSQLPAAALNTTVGRIASKYAIRPAQKFLNYKPFKGPVSIGNTIDLGFAGMALHDTPEAYRQYKANPGFGTGLNLAITSADLIPYSELFTGGKNIRKAYNYASDKVSTLFRGIPQNANIPTGINLETTPLRDAVTQPNIWPTSSPLPENMEPYVSKKIYPFNKEQEVFESFLSTDKQLKNIDSKSLYYDQAGKPITKSEADNLLYPPEYQKNGGDVDKAQWGLIKLGKNLYDGFKGADKAIDAVKIINKSGLDISNLGGTSKDIANVAKKIKDRLMTDKFITNNMNATGRTRQQVVESIENFTSEFNTGSITFEDFEKNLGGIYYGEGNIGINTKLKAAGKDDVLGIIDHEANHLFSDSKGSYVLVDGKLQKQPLYDNYPSLKITTDPSANIAGGSLYQSVAPEQQVRQRKAIAWLEENAGLEMGGDITEEMVEKLGIGLKEGEIKFAKRNTNGKWTAPPDEGGKFEYEFLEGDYKSGVEGGGQLQNGKYNDVGELLNNINDQSIVPPGSFSTVPTTPVGSKRWIKAVTNTLNKTYTVGAVGGLGAASQMIGPTQADGQFKEGGSTPKAQVGDKVASIASQMEVNEEDGGRPPLGVVDHIRALFDEEGLCRDNTCVQTVKDFYSKAGVEAIPKDVYNNREFLKNFKEYGFEEILDQKNLQPGDVLQYYYGPDSEDVKEDPSYLNFPYHMGVYVNPGEYIGDGDSEAPIQRQNMYTGTKDGKEYKKDPFKAFRYIKQNKNGGNLEKAQWGKLLKLAKKYGSKLLNYSKPAAKVDNTPSLKYTDDVDMDMDVFNAKAKEANDTRKEYKKLKENIKDGEGWKNEPGELEKLEVKSKFLDETIHFPDDVPSSDVYTNLTRYNLSDYLKKGLDKRFGTIGNSYTTGYGHKGLDYKTDYLNDYFKDYRVGLPDGSTVPYGKLDGSVEIDPSSFNSSDEVMEELRRLAQTTMGDQFNNAFEKTSRIDFGDLLKNKNRNGGWLSKYENGGVIEDDRGQWAHPGEVTKINSNNITMKGVNYPVLGISDTGDKKMMQPGKDYKFDGNSVTEYPMAKDGKSLVELDQLTNFTNYNTPQPGGWLNKYN